MALTDEEYAATHALASDLWDAANPFDKDQQPRQIPQVYVSIAMALARTGWRRNTA